ncbi:Slp family lipoprotein [Alteromonas sp. KUL49]|uniref:Slp family lipoprotein n=1 Tax=Alteromonas sp. KUL49 TaxID=2480798 RepID=UPI00102F0B09|nr:Slp family lipoprotein [Alteromonas sp. KUL49]TAP35495.1 Slp family lipoprotein [Alteromonas sp. KUL49]GEA13373.1 hypothetical protein KUL49_37480 [Alteromonas sp. KUL49]
MNIKILSILSVLFFTGCAIVPESIKVENEEGLVSYTQAVTTSATSMGKPARWGGVIVGVENKPDKTYVELVHFPLNNYGKPIQRAETIGRFKAELEGFVDPILFEEGRSVTFLGTLDAPLAGMIGEQPYSYPIIQAEDYHMWRKDSPYHPSGLHLNYHGGWYSPFFYPYHFRYHPWGRMWLTYDYVPRPVRYVDHRAVKVNLRNPAPRLNIPRTTRSQTAIRVSSSANRSTNRSVEH